MRIESWLWSGPDGWRRVSDRAMGDNRGADLVLVFGATEALERADAVAALRRHHPAAALLGCSSAGEIHGTEVLDGGIVATAIQFERSRVLTASSRIDSPGESAATGERLARALDPNGLIHVLVLADGLAVNGSALVAAMKRLLPASVAVTGGLAGDGDRFARTLVLLGDEPQPNLVAVCGFYGDSLRVGFGSMGGWDTFGPERTITRSAGNVLYELDGEAALDLYSRYLGSHAAELPASGLLFPLSVRTAELGEPVVRTIVGIDRELGSLTFVGEIPQGARARLMRANLDRLIDGASGAAERCQGALTGSAPELAILISCVGRRLVLKHRTEEELENVREVLGAQAVLCGFYSYGEIAPFVASARCELHNQTMTITTLSE